MSKYKTYYGITDEHGRFQFTIKGDPDSSEIRYQAMRRMALKRWWGATLTETGQVYPTRKSKKS